MRSRPGKVLLTHEQRSAIAKEAAKRRWDSRQAGSTSKIDAKKTKRRAVMNYVRKEVSDHNVPSYSDWEPPGNCVIPLNYAQIDQHEDFERWMKFDPEYVSFKRVVHEWATEYWFWRNVTQEALRKFPIRLKHQQF